MKLFIEHGEDDDLSNISEFMMDLDPNNKFVVLGFEYSISQDNFKTLKEKYNEFIDLDKSKISLNNIISFKSMRLFLLSSPWKTNN